MASGAPAVADDEAAPERIAAEQVVARAGRDLAAAGQPLRRAVASAASAPLPPLVAVVPHVKKPGMPNALPRARRTAIFPLLAEQVAADRAGVTRERPVAERPAGVGCGKR